MDLFFCKNSHEVTPYELYLKILYEYFKDEIDYEQSSNFNLPQGFLDLEYQKQAVLAAKRILDSYNGVFLADVVGLGKTYIAALLARQITEKKLIISPPVLIDYWEETLSQCGVINYKVESLGKLKQILRNGSEKYEYIFIDEAHRFRNEKSERYSDLKNICWGKKIVLISATPINNSYNDIYSLLKLFQHPKASSIPELPDLEAYFFRIINGQKGLGKNTQNDGEILENFSNDFRERVLKYVMIRRTRSEISGYFSEDIRKQGVKFPNINEPHAIVYEFDEDIANRFNHTIEYLMKFNYSLYTPLLYTSESLSDFEIQSQKNIRGFIKTILIKRLESSFFAFKKTINRLINDHQEFIKKYNTKETINYPEEIAIENLYEDDDKENFINPLGFEKTHRLTPDQFHTLFLNNLICDLQILKQIRNFWEGINKDPKLDKFLHELSNCPILKNKKTIIFTESAETGKYLYRALEFKYPGKVMTYSSMDGVVNKNKLNKKTSLKLIRQNFDPSCTEPKDDINILISTDILAEGINLHRSNIVINYDLPWNPVKVLQRVGRVNRIGTKHETIEIFNFFPADQAEKFLNLEDIIKSKLTMIEKLLGEDAKYLTSEENIRSYKFFGNDLFTEYEGNQEQSELKFLQVIKDIKINEPLLYNRIKELPLQVHSGKLLQTENFKNASLVFLRKGKLNGFYFFNGKISKKLSFLEAANILECEAEEKRIGIPSNFIEQLDSEILDVELDKVVSLLSERNPKGLRNADKKMLNFLQRLEKLDCYSINDKESINNLKNAVESKIIPDRIMRETKNKLRNELKSTKKDPFTILKILKDSVPQNYLNNKKNPRIKNIDEYELIASEYFFVK